MAIRHKVIELFCSVMFLFINLIFIDMSVVYINVWWNMWAFKPDRRYLALKIVSMHVSTMKIKESDQIIYASLILITVCLCVGGCFLSFKRFLTHSSSCSAWPNIQP